MSEQISEYADIKQKYGAEGAMKLTFLALFLVLSLGVATISLFFLYSKIPEPRYFAVREDNHFFSLPTLNNPTLSRGLLQNWVSNFALAAHSYDFQNFDKQVLNMKGYFTEDGYRDYLETMAQFSADIKEKQQLVSAIVTQAPSVQRSTLINNIYEWSVQVPLLVRFDSASATKSESRVLSLVIRRTDTFENPYGIAVSVFRSS